MPPPCVQPKHDSKLPRIKLRCARFGWRSQASWFKNRPHLRSKGRHDSCQYIQSRVEYSRVGANKISAFVFASSLACRENIKILLSFLGRWKISWGTFEYAGLEISRALLLYAWLMRSYVCTFLSPWQLCWKCKKKDWRRKSLLFVQTPWEIDKCKNGIPVTLCPAASTYSRTVVPPPASSAPATAVVQNLGTTSQSGKNFMLLSAYSAGISSHWVSQLAMPYTWLLLVQPPAFRIVSMSFRLFVANVACLLQASSGKSGLKMMPVSKLFTEAFHVKPATASEKLYAKDDVKDPIFHDSADCHIDAHCHRHLQPTLRHYRIKDETDLIKFCKVSAKAVLLWPF